jgi:hypothetical protein
VAAPPTTAAGEAEAVPQAERQLRSDDLEVLDDLCRSLLAALRALLDGYEPALAHLLRDRGEVREPAPAAPAAGTAPSDGTAEPNPPSVDTRPPPPPAAGITVSAGPFAGVEAIEEFQVALAMLPGVSEVAFRGYEGANRAIVDVELGSV